jgi:hypothetical protein
MSTDLMVESLQIWLVEYDVDVHAHHCLKMVFVLFSSTVNLIVTLP